MFKKISKKFSAVFKHGLIIRHFFRRLFFPFVSTYHWIAFHLRMRWLEMSEGDIREQYRLLIDLDWDEERAINSNITLRAIGSTVEITSKEKKFVITDSGGQIYVQSLKEKQRVVEKLPSWKISTRWHDVYRSGEYIRDSEFVTYLVATTRLVNLLRQDMAYLLHGIQIPIEDDAGKPAKFTIEKASPLTQIPGFVIRDSENRGGEISFLDAEGFLKENNKCATVG